MSHCNCLLCKGVPEKSVPLGHRGSQRPAVSPEPRLLALALVPGTICAPEELRPCLASLGGDTRGEERVGECVSLCPALLFALSSHLNQLFLGVMTSSPLILHSHCWASMESVGLAGPSSNLSQVYLQEPPLPMVTLRSGFMSLGASPVWQIPASQHALSHCRGQGAGTPRAALRLLLAAGRGRWVSRAHGQRG